MQRNLVLIHPSRDPAIHLEMVKNLARPRQPDNRVFAGAFDDRRACSLHLGAAPREDLPFRLSLFQLPHDGSAEVIAAGLKGGKQD